MPRDPNRFQPVQQCLPGERPFDRPVAPSLPALPVARLARNSSYPRLLPTSPLPDAGRVFRKRCSGCGTNFTLLPNDVAPGHSYGLELIAARLAASLEGEPDRSQRFYDRQNLIPDEPDQSKEEQTGRGTSWSDRLNARPLRPSHRLFSHWRSKWAIRGQSWLPWLLLASLLSRCDLKMRFAESLTCFENCPAQLRPLAIAVGLVALHRRETVWTSLTRTVFLVGCRPSHKIARAAGRPPPQYGGDLEFGELGSIFHNTEVPKK